MKPTFQPEMKFSSHIKKIEMLVGQLKLKEVLMVAIKIRGTESELFPTTHTVSMGLV